VYAYVVLVFMYVSIDSECGIKCHSIIQYSLTTPSLSYFITPSLATILLICCLVVSHWLSLNLTFNLPKYGCRDKLQTHQLYISDPSTIHTLATSLPAYTPYFELTHWRLEANRQGSPPTLVIQTVFVLLCYQL